MVGSQQVAAQAPERAVFLLEAEGKEAESNEIQAIDEEEQAQVPASLPNAYQPKRSEYLDHCPRHYLFRAWYRHCLEGQGR